MEISVAIDYVSMLTPLADISQLLVDENRVKTVLATPPSQNLPTNLMFILIFLINSVFILSKP